MEVRHAQKQEHRSGSATGKVSLGTEDILGMMFSTQSIKLSLAENFAQKQIFIGKDSVDSDLSGNWGVTWVTSEPSLDYNPRSPHSSSAKFSKALGFPSFKS